jgi:sugar phosphate permease
VLWALTVYDRPQEARWISEARKNYLVQTLAAEQQAIAGKEVKNASLGAVLSDKTMWQLIALNFFYQTGIYGYTLWLPTILKELTHTSIGQVGMLAILPFGAIAGMFLFSSLSDRTGKRKLFVSLPLIGFALCMFLSVALKETSGWPMPRWWAAASSCNPLLACSGPFRRVCSAPKWQAARAV